MSQPRVSVVIPHLNDHARLPRCLELLQRQSYPSELTEIVVVDNGSSRPIRDIIAAFPGVREAFEAERGCGTARNRGVQLSRGEILAFTDSDCLPDRDWVANGVQRLIAPGAPDILGGDILIFCGDERHPTEVELYEKVFGFQQQLYVRRKHFAAGANIITTRPVFEKVGGFRNGRLPEDLEWGRRATAMGYRVGFAPDAVVKHPARRSWSDLRWKMDRTIFHQRNAMREQDLFLLRWILFGTLYAVPPVDKIWEVVISPHLAGTMQRLAAIRILIRLRYYRVVRMAGCLWDASNLGQERFHV